MGRARPIVSPVLCVSRVEGVRNYRAQPRDRCTPVTTPGGLVLARTRQGERDVRCKMRSWGDRPHRVHARKNIGWPRADALHCTTSESLEDGCEVLSRRFKLDVVKGRDRLPRCNYLDAVYPQRIVAPPSDASQTGGIPYHSWR